MHNMKYDRNEISTHLWKFNGTLRDFLKVYETYYKTKVELLFNREKRNLNCSFADISSADLKVTYKRNV